MARPTGSLAGAIMLPQQPKRRSAGRGEDAEDREDMEDARDREDAEDGVS